MSFRVLTFNMQFGQAWQAKDPDSGPICMGRTIEFLQAYPADIFLLQEVERGQPNGVQTQPPTNYTLLQKSLPHMASVFAYPPVNSDELPFGIALAIFASAPLRHFFTETLPAPALEFQFGNKKVKPTPRQVIGATTVLEGRELRILNTHLQAFFMIQSNSNEHPAQRNELEKILRQSSLPTILGGDFNCTPGENLVDQFRAAGFSTVQNSVPTWRRHPYILDHIFHNTALRLIQSEVLPTPCSDHHAVVAELEFVN